MGCIQNRRNITVTVLHDENGEIIPPNNLKENEFCVDKNVYSFKRPETKDVSQNSHINKTKSDRRFSSFIHNDCLKSRKSLGMSFRDYNRKLTQEIEKIEDFEKRWKNTTSAKFVAPVDILSQNPQLALTLIKEEDKDKEKDTINTNVDNVPKKIGNNTIKFNNTDNEDNEEFFVEGNSPLAGYNSNKENFKIKVISMNEDEKIENNNFITGLDITRDHNRDGTKLSSGLNNNFEGNKPRYKKSDFTDMSHTIDYSSIEDKSPTQSPYKVLKKYNLNPYHNFNIVKKYFIYQLQKGFIQAKKFMINNEVHRGEETKKNPNYHEIFTNYSQISSTSVTNYVKYEDHNIKINNYYIQKNKILGKGGFSTVYLCQHLSDGKNYAVKITDKNVRANAKKKKYDYVKDEVIILKRLYSKYVVKTYEILETKNECLIVMEYMKNNSLFGKINSLNDYTTWKYFRNLICGLEHCHEIAKIIHRDINVNNLLISNDDVLKLSDFGISMIIEEDDLIPIKSGPTTYTPPEKKYNKNSHYNGKPADLWCCGVTLYHMVYKQPLFKNNGNVSNFEYNVKLPDSTDDSLDENLKELMRKLLDVEPSHRYTISDIKKNLWITKNGEFPLPDVHEEALEYVYSLTSQEIMGFKDNEIKEDFSP